MRVLPYASVCLSVCVVSESEVFSRRHATPQHDRGFIDWGCDGGGKNSCRLEDGSTIIHNPRLPNLHRIPDPAHITSAPKRRGGEEAADQAIYIMPDAWSVSLINFNYQHSLSSDFPYANKQFSRGYY